MNENFLKIDLQLKCDQIENEAATLSRNCQLTETCHKLSH